MPAKRHISSLCRDQLFVTSFWRNPSATRLLLQNGAGPDVLDKNGYTFTTFLYGKFRPRTAQTETIDIMAEKDLPYFNIRKIMGSRLCIVQVPGARQQIYERCIDPRLHQISALSDLGGLQYSCQSAIRTWRLYKTLEVSARAGES
jgi:hypothetical protein